MPTFKPHEYQTAMVEFAMDELFVKGKPGVGLLADPGLGKTATTLEIL